MNIRLDEKNARKIYNDLSALRDEAMWAEDALGLDDTEEKKILDKALDALLALNQSSPVIIVGVCKEDNSRDVDEAYGAGTYARLFPENDNDSE